MVWAISSGLPLRLSGTPATKPAFLSAVPVNRFSISVSTGPGATALTRTSDAGLSFGTGVVDGYVQATEARDGLIDLGEREPSLFHREVLHEAILHPQSHHRKSR
jgi:hypothetical protein